MKSLVRKRSLRPARRSWDRRQPSLLHAFAAAAAAATRLYKHLWPAECCSSAASGLMCDVELFVSLMRRMKDHIGGLSRSELLHGKKGSGKKKWEVQKSRIPKFPGLVRSLRSEL